MNVQFHYIADEVWLRRCWPVFSQLRPDLSEEEFVERWRAQDAEGYRILSARKGDVILGAAGFRFLTTMAWGRILYLDDLIVDDTVRGAGLGSRLLDKLKDLAQEEGCRQVHLDTGYHRHAAHRVYARNGFQFNCHHLAFTLPL